MSHPLLNSEQIRAFTFDVLKRVRPGLAGKMTRIADSFFDALESRLRQRIFMDVQEGGKSELKTLRPVQGDEERPADQPWLINQSGVHSFATAAIGNADNGLTQIATNYINAADLFVRRAIEARLAAMPSAGRTIQ